MRNTMRGWAEIAKAERGPEDRRLSSPPPEAGTDLLSQNELCVASKPALKQSA